MALDAKASVQSRQPTELRHSFGAWLSGQVLSRQNTDTRKGDTVESGSRGRAGGYSSRRVLVSAVVGLGATLRSRPLLAARAVASGMAAGFVLQTTLGWGLVHLSHYVLGLYPTAFLTAFLAPIVVSWIDPEVRAAAVLIYTIWYVFWGCGLTIYYRLDELNPYAPSLTAFVIAQCGNLTGAVLSLVHAWRCGNPKKRRETSELRERGTST